MDAKGCWWIVRAVKLPPGAEPCLAPPTPSDDVASGPLEFPRVLRRVDILGDILGCVFGVQHIEFCSATSIEAAGTRDGEIAQLRRQDQQFMDLPSNNMDKQ